MKIKTAGLILGIGVVIGVSLFLWLTKREDAKVTLPATAVVNQSEQNGTTGIRDSSSAILRTGRRSLTRVNVIIPAGTVVGDDTNLVVEVVAEDTTGTAVEEAVARYKPRPIDNVIRFAPTPSAVARQAVFGVCAGPAYEVFGGAGLRATAAVTVRLLRSFHLQGGALLMGGDGIDLFGGPAFKVGELLGMKILAGAGIAPGRRVIVTLSIGG